MLFSSKSRDRSRIALSTWRLQTKMAMAEAKLDYTSTQLAEASSGSWKMNGQVQGLKTLMQEAQVQIDTLKKENEAIKIQKKESDGRLSAALQGLGELGGDLSQLRGGKLEGKSEEQLMALEIELERYLKKVRTARVDARVEALEKTTECVVCMAAERCVLLLPCAHLCLCEACAADCPRCPLCREVIKEKIKSFSA